MAFSNCEKRKMPLREQVEDNDHLPAPLQHAEPLLRYPRAAMSGVTSSSLPVVSTIIFCAFLPYEQDSIRNRLYSKNCLEDTP